MVSSMMSREDNTPSIIYPGVGEYNTPEIPAFTDTLDIDRWIEFAYCRRTRADRYDRSKIGVHFFEYDYKFERVWSHPSQSGLTLCDFGVVASPDFTIQVENPKAMNIFNHYRKHWLARYWSENFGVRIIPTIGWTDKDSYSWCFDGEPEDSVVMISDVGCRRYGKQMFLDGYNEMLVRLQPRKVICLSRTFDDYPGPVQFVRWELRKGDQLNG